MNGVVIVGAGLAGSRCAEALRAGGCELPVTIVGAEPVAPYERPALSKEFLAGTRLEADLLLRPPGSWGERDIDLRLDATVERVDLRRRLVLIRGRELHWTHLVLATGARARPLPGVAFPNVHHLRTLADARGAPGCDPPRLDGSSSSAPASSEPRSLRRQSGWERASR